MQQSHFHENVVIITGASSGIGEQLAYQLAKTGAWLALAARSQPALEKVAGECQTSGGKVISFPVDITNEAQCQRLVEETLNTYGRIDTLINNAGAGMQCRFDQLSELTALQTTMNVNYWGSVYMTRWALPHLKKSHGRIVVINSGSGLFAAPECSGYSASKHALAGFFDSLRIELTGNGVSIASVYPDWVATGITSRSLGADGKPVNRTNSNEQRGISAEKCAQQIILAAGKRKRDAMSARQRFGLFLTPLFPQLVDKILADAFLHQD